MQIFPLILNILVDNRIYRFKKKRIAIYLIITRVSLFSVDQQRTMKRGKNTEISLQREARYVFRPTVSIETANIHLAWL